MARDDNDTDGRTGIAPAAVPLPPPSVAPTQGPIPPLIIRRERPRVREAGRLVVIALTLGWAFDALCGGGTFGVGFPIFVVCLLGALFSLAVREDVTVRRGNVVVLAAPLLFFAAMTAVRANAFLTFWNVTA